GKTPFQVIPVNLNRPWGAGGKKLPAGGVQRAGVARIEIENARSGKFLKGTVEAAQDGSAMPECVQHRKAKALVERRVNRKSSLVVQPAKLLIRNRAQETHHAASGTATLAALRPFPHPTGRPDPP